MVYLHFMKYNRVIYAFYSQIFQKTSVFIEGEKEKQMQEIANIQENW